MQTKRETLSAKDIFSLSPIIPVIVIEDLAKVIPLAKAIIKGGIKVLEITLRTPCALEAIRLLRQEFPDIIVGAGTVLSETQLHQSIEVDAQFVISPGYTLTLLKAAMKLAIPSIPGASSVSELMTAMELGYSHFKFFPAEATGGIAMLKSIYGPLPNLRFCATGGIDEKNVLDYLSLPNVECVGGSWLVPRKMMQQGNWQSITELTCSAMAKCVDHLA